MNPASLVLSGRAEKLHGGKGGVDNIHGDTHKHQLDQAENTPKQSHWLATGLIWQQKSNNIPLQRLLKRR